MSNIDVLSFLTIVKVLKGTSGLIRLTRPENPAALTHCVSGNNPPKLGLFRKPRAIASSACPHLGMSGFTFESEPHVPINHGISFLPCSAHDEQSLWPLGTETNIQHKPRRVQFLTWVSWYRRSTLKLHCHHFVQANGFFGFSIHGPPYLVSSISTLTLLLIAYSIVSDAYQNEISTTRCRNEAH